MAVQGRQGRRQDGMQRNATGRRPLLLGPPPGLRAGFLVLPASESPATNPLAWPLNCTPAYCSCVPLLQPSWTSTTAATRPGTSASTTLWLPWTWPPTRRCAGSAAA